MLVPCSSALFQTSISLPWQVQMCPSALERALLRQSRTDSADKPLVTWLVICSLPSWQETAL